MPATPIAVDATLYTRGVLDQQPDAYIHSQAARIEQEDAVIAALVAAVNRIYDRVGLDTVADNWGAFPSDIVADNLTTLKEIIGVIETRLQAEQIPVADIAERDALTTFSGLIAYVVNATADPQVDATSPSATYIRNQANTAWIRFPSPGDIKTFVGATALLAGQQGLVPAPPAGQHERALCGDRGWRGILIDRGKVTSLAAPLPWSIYKVDATAGAFTINLDNVVDKAGIICFTKADTSNNLVTLTSNAGAQTHQLRSQGASCFAYVDGTKYILSPAPTSAPNKPKMGCFFWDNQAGDSTGRFSFGQVNVSPGSGITAANGLITFPAGIGRVFVTVNLTEKMGAAGDSATIRIVAPGYNQRWLRIVLNDSNWPESTDYVFDCRTTGAVLDLLRETSTGNGNTNGFVSFVALPEDIMLPLDAATPATNQFDRSPAKYLPTTRTPIVQAGQVAYGVTDNSQRSITFPTAFPSGGTVNVQLTHAFFDGTFSSRNFTLIGAPTLTGFNYRGSNARSLDQVSWLATWIPN